MDGILSCAAVSVFGCMLLYWNCYDYVEFQNTAYNLVAGDMIAAASYGLSALQDAFGIVLGIVCVLSLPGSWFGNKNQRNRNEN